MVTATNGTFTFIGASGRIYNIDGYISDVVGGKVNFGLTGTANSTDDTYWNTPEPVSLIRFTIKSGPTVATAITMTQDSVPLAGAVLRFTNFLDSLANPSALKIDFPARVLVGAKQS